MERAVPVLQVVGYQNSGKTTLAEKLIRALTNEGVRVGTIKHHGHGGYPELPLQKDSERHREAGAIVSAVEGDGLLSLSATSHWSLEKIIRLYTCFEAEVVIVEGYKKEQYPKVVLLRSDEDASLLESVENVIAVITWNEAPETWHENYKVFRITEEAEYIKWLVQRMRDAK
ncbi:molybdopterin-guanine dinucleotide biosynthesis protein B [Bacillus sp. 3103sda1]|uniref:molybdopterin-guanine dinucleotide biosynthesis protein B n=1 Tax=unclassified Bacillus (in: firmicutes) TaxID=185979 RepID=UPI00209DADD7|nr:MULTISPECIES: molybdopterin-guanine dinucleotide biosynthesis protein B [unclassified Bacillus (in: firmicutes)]MCP1125612.1 molybdopterin-guanine dinucleotide biosynthesis protein B [Bacillus sp. 3103sda1]